MRMLRTLALLGSLLLALAACGGDDSQTSGGTGHNDADVAFATGMIPHHAQALAMVDMTAGRDLDPEVRQLTDDIRAAQAPEIEKMAGWLRDWDEPVPPTVRDHMHADDGMGDGMDGMDGESQKGENDGMGDGMGDMPGMMSGSDFTALANASDAEFQRMWLQMMIEHHEGAVEMAQTEQEKGAFGPALELARDIESSQEAEIEHMKELLDAQ